MASFSRSKRLIHSWHTNPEAHRSEISVASSRFDSAATRRGRSGVAIAVSGGFNAQSAFVFADDVHLGVDVHNALIRTSRTNRFGA